MQLPVVLCLAFVGQLARGRRVQITFLKAKDGDATTEKAPPMLLSRRAPDAAFVLPAAGLHFNASNSIGIRPCPVISAETWRASALSRVAVAELDLNRGTSFRSFNGSRAQMRYSVPKMDARDCKLKRLVDKWHAKVRLAMSSPKAAVTAAPAGISQQATPVSGASDKDFEEYFARRPPRKSTEVPISVTAAAPTAESSGIGRDWRALLQEYLARNPSAQSAAVNPSVAVAIPAVERSKKTFWEYLARNQLSQSAAAASSAAAATPSAGPSDNDFEEYFARHSTPAAPSVAAATPIAVASDKDFEEYFARHPPTKSTGVPTSVAPAAPTAESSGIARDWRALLNDYLAQNPSSQSAAATPSAAVANPNVEGSKKTFWEYLARNPPPQSAAAASSAAAATPSAGLSDKDFEKYLTRHPPTKSTGVPTSVTAAAPTAESSGIGRDWRELLHEYLARNPPPQSVAAALTITSATPGAGPSDKDFEDYFARN